MFDNLKSKQLKTTANNSACFGVGFIISEISMLPQQKDFERKFNQEVLVLERVVYLILVLSLKLYF